MALQSSGAITLANIQTEFGGSNPISLNEYYRGGGYVPSSVSAVPASGTISIGNFYGTSNYVPTGYWISEVTVPSTLSVYDGWHGADFDSSGNVYAVGKFNTISSITTSSPSGSYAKFNSNGELQWINAFTKDTTSYWRIFDAVKVLANGNIAAVGAIQSGANNLGFTYIVFDSSGTVQYSFSKFYGAGSYYNCMTSDSSSNIYVCASPNTSTYSYEGGLWKYNGSLTEQFNKWITDYSSSTGNGTFLFSVKVDSSGNIYLAGQTRPSNSWGYGAVVMKLDSSGAISWQQYAGAAVGSSASPAVFIDVSVNSSGDVYAAGYSNKISGDGYAVDGTYYPMFMKCDSSGTRQTWRYWRSAGARFTSIVHDSSNNYYILGYFGTFGSYKVFLLKYNSSDVLQWARTIRNTATSMNVQCWNLRINSAGTKLLLSGYRGTQNISAASNGNLTAVLLCLPTDGSKTGTYGTYVYEANSDSEGTSGIYLSYSSSLYVGGSFDSSIVSGYGTSYTVSNAQTLSVTSPLPTVL